MNATQFLAELRAIAPVTIRCGHCSFQTLAPLEEARAAFEEHTCKRPKPPPAKRRSGFRFR